MCSYILTEKFTLTTLSKFYRIENTVEKKEILREKGRKRVRERDKKVAGKKRKECANIRRASLREKDEEGNKGKYISIFFTKKQT